jgi:hypothetical protein
MKSCFLYQFIYKTMNSVLLKLLKTGFFSIYEIILLNYELVYEIMVCEYNINPQHEMDSDFS